LIAAPSESNLDAARSERPPDERGGFFGRPSAVENQIGGRQDRRSLGCVHRVEILIIHQVTSLPLDEVGRRLWRLLYLIEKGKDRSGQSDVERRIEPDEEIDESAACAMKTREWRFEQHERPALIALPDLGAPRQFPDQFVQREIVRVGALREPALRATVFIRVNVS
jgi:hypothetical protein